MRLYMPDDRASAVKNIQRLLKINESGIYDARTAQAVRAAQRSFGLDDNGRVDLPTFSAVLEMYRRNERTRSYTSGVDTSAFPYDVGAYGVGVREIIQLLYSALVPYSMTSSALRGAIYTVGVGDAAKKLREIYGLPIATYVDEDMYVRIRRELLTENG